MISIKKGIKDPQTNAGLQSRIRQRSVHSENWPIRIVCRQTAYTSSEDLYGQRFYKGFATEGATGRTKPLSFFQ
jgi:hypothetical protein